ncbi:hypothetical protein CB1_000692007 [Camelus ferus]|nr:hypothetical protein CB1_000692007 [Camelus ferus]
MNVSSFGDKDREEKNHVSLSVWTPKASDYLSPWVVTKVTAAAVRFSPDLQTAQAPRELCPAGRGRDWGTEEEDGQAQGGGGIPLGGFTWKRKLQLLPAALVQKPRCT